LQVWSAAALENFLLVDIRRIPILRPILTGSQNPAASLCSTFRAYKANSAKVFQLAPAFDAFFTHIAAVY
jgi:hypothetical protein